MEADGYSLDDKRDKIDRNDIPDILKSWSVREKVKEDDRKAKHFFIPVNEIKDNNYDLSINRYKEIVYEEIEYDSPQEIINGKGNEPGLKQLTKERLSLIKELEEMLR